MDAVPKLFALLGDPAAEACEGESCLIPASAAVPTVPTVPSAVPTIQE